MNLPFCKLLAPPFVVAADTANTTTTIFSFGALAALPLLLSFLLHLGTGPMFCSRLVMQVLAAGLPSRGASTVWGSTMRA